MKDETNTALSVEINLPVVGELIREEGIGYREQ